jgi:hypothetical protein
MISMVSLSSWVTLRPVLYTPVKIVEITFNPYFVLVFPINACTVSTLSKITPWQARAT